MVLKVDPTEPALSTLAYRTEKRRIRTPITADDPRIERVFEISRIPRNRTGGEEEKEEKEDEKEVEMVETVEVEEGEGEGDGEGSGSWWKGMKAKSEVNGKGGVGSAKLKVCRKALEAGPRHPRAPTPIDSSEDDWYEDDDGSPEANEKGKGLKMQVSHKPRPDFLELKYEHLGGTVWEILTGIEARTKFTNGELRNEGT